MSLNVYLTIEHAVSTDQSATIPIRLDGATKLITRKVWDTLYPGREPVEMQRDETSTCVYSANITHNLGAMAQEAGIYYPLWRPEEVGITEADQLIAPLQAGLDTLHANPALFMLFNRPNGWGTLESLISFTQGYLDACIRWPHAKIRVSR